MTALDHSIDTTYQPKAFDFANDRPALFRTGADIQLPERQEARCFYKLVGSSGGDRTVLVSSSATPWLSTVLHSTASFRTAQFGWDGQNSRAAEQSMLDASEMLAVLLSNYARSELLTFSVDSRGRPTFAGRSPDFYLHLTIDDANHITWYAEKSGVEYFDGDVEFKGRHVPSGLLELLS
jgi:hypothetical protein